MSIAIPSPLLRVSPVSASFLPIWHSAARATSLPPMRVSICHSGQLISTTGSCELVLHGDSVTLISRPSSDSASQRLILCTDKIQKDYSYSALQIYL